MIILFLDDCLCKGVVFVRLGLSLIVLVGKLFEIVKEVNCSFFEVNCFDIEYYLKYWIFDGICNNFENFLWGVVVILFIWMLDLVYYDLNGFLDFVGFFD